MKNTNLNCQIHTFIQNNDINSLSKEDEVSQQITTPGQQPFIITKKSEFFYILDLPDSDEDKPNEPQDSLDGNYRNEEIERYYIGEEETITRGIIMIRYPVEKLIIKDKSVE